MDRKTYLALLCLAAAYFTVGVGSLAVIGVVRPMAEELHVSAAAIANLVTVFALTFALCAPLAQIVLGHLPRRSLLLTGLTILSVSAALGAISHDYWTLLATRVAMGAGAAMVGPMASAIGAGMVAPALQGRALSTVFGGMTLATVLGVPATAWLGGLLGWRAVFLLVAGAGGLALVAIGLLVSDRGRAAPTRLTPLGRVLTQRRSGFSVATTLLQMAAQFATYALIAPFLTERASVSAGWIAPALFIFGIGGVVANLLAGRLADRMGGDRTVLWSLYGMGGVFAALSVLPGSPWLAMAMLLLWANTGMVFQAPQQKRLVQIDPASRSLLLAGNASALYLGMSLRSFLAGIVHNVGGAGAMPVASLLLVIAAIATFSLSRDQRPVSIEAS